MERVPYRREYVGTTHTPWELITASRLVLSGIPRPS
jgi:hypothetical protein